MTVEELIEKLEEAVDPGAEVILVAKGSTSPIANVVDQTSEVYLEADE